MFHSSGGPTPGKLVKFKKPHAIRADKQKLAKVATPARRPNFPCLCEAGRGIRAAEGNASKRRRKAWLNDEMSEKPAS
ncbi:hypothetical protein QV13_10410 [Mesorhizobium hungaricum]|uniref:Uncharacterized protein n=1 Tax=Mesorhizobium hungaricum TaxID=1566387 RepID=A0A1C2DZ15_9HYPH|nr:hypothetical protein QV13_10410 [Mesorhizobium hungaricum]